MARSGCEPSSFIYRLNLTLEPETLIWVKMKSQLWPAKVADPPSNSPFVIKTDHCYVYFFGTHNTKLIFKANIIVHSDKTEENFRTSKKSSALHNAFEEMKREIKKREKLKSLSLKEKISPGKSTIIINLASSPKIIVEEASTTNTTFACPPMMCKLFNSNYSEKQASDIKKDPIKQDPSNSSTICETQHSASVDYNERPPTYEMIPCTPSSNEILINSGYVSNNIQEPIARQTTISPHEVSSNIIGSRDESVNEIETSLNGNATILHDDVSGLISQSVVNENASSSDVLTNFTLLPDVSSNDFSLNNQPGSDESPETTSLVHNSTAIVDEHSFRNQVFGDLAKYVPLNTSLFTNGLETKILKATDKEIGFLGLEQLGRVIVKKLIRSGHLVTVWDASDKICNDLVREGAEKAKVPKDVIHKCDIIFCSLSVKSIKDVVFGKNGVLEGYEMCKGSCKGFVMMTSLDPKYSQEISEVIAKKCGIYLEAPIMGSIQLAEEKSLRILCAGNIELFGDCYTCFVAIANRIFYVGDNIGSAFKLKIVLSMVTESICAALLEIVSAMYIMKLPWTFFIDYIKSNEGPLGCSTILKDAVTLLKNYSKTTGYLEGVTEASVLGKDCQLPLLLAAATKSFFTNATETDFKALSTKYTEAMQKAQDKKT